MLPIERDFRAGVPEAVICERYSISPERMYAMFAPGGCCGRSLISTPPSSAPKPLPKPKRKYCGGAPKGVLPKAARMRRALTMEQAREIRRLRADGMTLAALARQYNVQHGTIRQIVRNLTYKEQANGL